MDTADEQRLFESLRHVFHDVLTMSGTCVERGPGARA
jgi:hypothetical protein